MEQVDNIFLFNLISSLDQGGGSPAQLAHLSLNEFLEHLVTDDGLQWRYDPTARSRRYGDTSRRTRGRPFTLP